MRIPAALLATALLGTLTACATIGQGAALRETSTAAPTASAPPALPALPSPTSTPSSSAPSWDGATVGTPAEARRKLARAINTSSGVRRSRSTPSSARRVGSSRRPRASRPATATGRR